MALLRFHECEPVITKTHQVRAEFRVWLVNVKTFASRRVSYTLEHNAPVVTTLLNSQPLKMLVDTGAPQSTIDSRLASIPVGGNAVKAVILGGAGQSISFRVKDLTAIRRGLGCQAVLGNSFLRNYVALFDTASSSIELIKPPPK